MREGSRSGTRSSQTRIPPSPALASSLVAHDGPVYERPLARPPEQDVLLADRAENLRRPSGGGELRETVLRLAGSPNLCDRSWVTDQYDRYVLGNTVLAQPEDAGMIRVDEESGLGVALSTDCNGRFARLDPYAGAQLALAEAHRNVAVSGARPLAVSDCLNFGSPEEPAVMWQFAEAVRGLADGCRELGIPVTGGNVSLYNQTGTTPILPTPVVAVLGVIDDVRRRTRTGFPKPGLTVLQLGETREELSGSEWAHVVHGHLGGQPPRVDLAAEQALGEVMVAAAADGLVAAAHDLADGGLAQALVEACLRHDVGVVVRVEADPFTALFSESTARAVVAVRPEDQHLLEALCAEQDVPVAVLGTTRQEPALEVEGEFRIPLEELRSVWSATIPAAMTR